MDWLSKINEMKQLSGMTTNDISIKSGIPVGTLNKIFAGQTKDPQISTAAAIIHAMGFTLDDLDNIKNPPDKAEGPYLTDKAYEVARAYQDADQRSRDIVCFTLGLEPDKSSSPSSDAAV